MEPASSIFTPCPSSSSFLTRGSRTRLRMLGDRITCFTWLEYLPGLSILYLKVKQSEYMSSTICMKLLQTPTHLRAYCRSLCRTVSKAFAKSRKRTASGSPWVPVIECFHKLNFLRQFTPLVKLFCLGLRSSESVRWEVCAL